MLRCISLARNGAGYVSPNPMVGCVIVCDDRIIAEGWHRKYGEAHAEVNAIQALQDKSVLARSTMYVNLEPCSHFGKTPPCADLIVQHKPARVVIGMSDPFHEVSGRGIQKLKDAGIPTTVGVLEHECRELNRRFIKFHTRQQPYVILKWAQTINGLIAPYFRQHANETYHNERHITGKVVQKLVHKWRTEEGAIMVGTNTALYDDPALNAREWEGKNPVRITIDKHLRLPQTLKLFDGSAPTIVFTENQKNNASGLHYITIPFDENICETILGKLYQEGIQSLVVEGGTRLLNSFISLGLWDEAIVFTAPKHLTEGVAAPLISGSLAGDEMIGDVKMAKYRNG